MQPFKFLFVVFIALLCARSPLQGQEVLFEDQFEGSLKPGWVWLHENTSNRRFVNNSLEILTEPLFSGFSGVARNALVRPLNFLRMQNGRTTDAYRIETECYFLEKPTCQFQQCGVYWMQNDKVVFKLVFAYVDGMMCVLPGKFPVKSSGGKLRITVTGRKFVAEYCDLNEEEFRPVYEGFINPTAADRISLQCWGGRRPQGDWQDNDPAKRWARFAYFRVEKIQD